MGSRSRIRWQKVAKLALGVAGSVALFLVLPSLIRRPEPPPLEPDIGLTSVTASREPMRPERRSASQPHRRTGHGREETGNRPRRELHREPQGDRSEGGRLVHSAHALRQDVPGPADSSDTTFPAPAAPPVPVPVVAVTPPSTPAPDPPPAARTSRAPAASEFGFER
jgi:hypothetical protein